VKPTERLGEARAPDGTVLTLYRHDGAYSIRANGVELMSTRRHHSEDRLAELACAPLAGVPGARVLVGGLGLGFTLRAALGALAGDARVVVAELVTEVIAWNRTPEFGLAADALADPRVELRHADVADVLAGGRAAFDAIMLDVDNGAESFTTAGNARLYGPGGIRLAVEALRPGGRLAYWSATPEPAFEAALRRARLRVEATRVRAHPAGGPWHHVYVAHAVLPRAPDAAGDRGAGESAREAPPGSDG
jgi:spermidine synthase